MHSALQLLGQSSLLAEVWPRDSVRWTKAVSADAAVAALAARALQEEDWEDTDEAVSEAWEACGFQTLREDVFAFSSPVQVKEDEDERRSNSPARLPEVQSGFFARARQESGGLEVDVGLVGDEALSSAAIAKCEDLAGR